MVGPLSEGVVLSADTRAASPGWTSNNAATSGLMFSSDLVTQRQIALAAAAAATAAVAAATAMPARRANKNVLNEVVVGAMMAAYERAGRWEQVRA